jgi:hypothetical protein
LLPGALLPDGPKVPLNETPRFALAGRESSN